MKNLLLSFIMFTSLAHAQAPALKVGDSWKMQSLDTTVNPPTLQWSQTRTVISVDAQETARLIEPNTGDKFVAVHDATTDKRLTTYKHEESAPDRKGKKLGDWSKSDSFVQFPLEIGKKWEVHRSRRLNNGQSVITDLKAEVLALEKVQTPAGEFEAYKISLRGSWRNTGSGNTGPNDGTLWYAPAAKEVVKYVGETRWSTVSKPIIDQWHEELIELKLAP